MSLLDRQKSSRLVPKHFSRFISEGIWKDTPVPHWIALSGFLFFTIAILIAGWYFVEHQKRLIKLDRQEELEAIADLKIQQLEQWRNDKLWDAELVRNNRILAKQTGEWIERGMPRDFIYKKLVTRMRDQLNAQRLDAILLISPEGKRLLRVGKAHEIDKDDEYFCNALTIPVHSQKSYFADICRGHIEEDDVHQHLDLFIPLLASEPEGLKVTAVMVFRVDPDRFLLPIVESWPTSSYSAESVLLSPTKHGISTLSGRRHAAEVSNHYFNPPEDRMTPPAMAAAGQEGVLEHLDYRNVPVLSIVRKVDGASWFLVTKMDIDEIYAPVFQMARNVMLAVLAFIFANGVTAFHWWRQMRASYLAGHYQTEIKRQLLEQRFNALTQHGNDIILLVNSAGRIVEVNERAVEAFGLSRESLLSLDIGDLRPAEEQEASMQQRMKLRQEGALLFEAQFLRRNGEAFPSEVSARLIELDNEFYFQGIIRDITEQKKAQEQIEFIAQHDALTGLPNRLLLHDRLSQCLVRAQRNKDRAAVLFLDFDRFKNINDSLGHSVGDGVLKAVAQRLKTCVREGDTVARLGGDEFVIVIPDLQDAESVAQVAAKIVEMGSEPYVVDDHQLRLTISVGISIFPDDGMDNEALLKNADAAMYHAKESGRDRYHFYTQDMNAKALDILRMENDLQRALVNEELSLCYQPQVDLASGRIIGAEALLRWKHPVKGQISPSRFIPVAEERGLIASIGAWVLETACGQNRQWQRDGLRPIPISVNISPPQLQHADFASKLEKVLEETDLQPEMLELELTEGAVMQDAEGMIDLLGELKKMGVRLAIDDFGTGYSSLNYLKRFPIDCLKIDRSFIKDLAANAEEEAIPKAIIGMGRTLKMKTIAEGVETEAQLSILKQAGCDAFQGFYFSKPVAAEEFAELLREEKMLQD